MSDPEPPSDLGRRLSAWLSRERVGPAESVPPDGTARPLAATPLRTVRAAVTPVLRARSGAERQAQRVEALRRLAHEDAATGLPNRRHFVARLALALAEPSAGLGLILVRARAPRGLEAVHGVVADLLGAYPARVGGAFAGRLNATDFALALPVHGLAAETAETLARTLRASPPSGPARAEIAIGGVDGLGTGDVGPALAAADEALAQAEAAGSGCVQINGIWREAPLGERAWRVRLDEAMAEGRVMLAEFPVVDPAGRLLHLECPLRVQLEVAGPFSAARAWLPMAARHRLLPQIDLLALDLAIVAASRDGRARSVHVSVPSLAASGFVGAVSRRLEAAALPAGTLWLEVADGGWQPRAGARLREAAAAWRRHGVRMGLEHAGASVDALARFGGCRIDYVKIDARFVHGVATDAVVSDYAAGLTGLARSLGLQVIAEGVDDGTDLPALWALGFGGATGPALR